MFMLDPSEHMAPQDGDPVLAITVEDWTHRMDIKDKAIQERVRKSMLHDMMTKLSRMGVFRYSHTPVRNGSMALSTLNLLVVPPRMDVHTGQVRETGIESQDVYNTGQRDLAIEILSLIDDQDIDKARIRELLEFKLIGRMEPPTSAN